jgi:hypothetical protein
LILVVDLIVIQFLEMTNYNHPPFKAKNVESEMSHLFNANSFSRYNQQSKASTFHSPSFLNSDNKTSNTTTKKTNDLLFERVLFTEKKRPVQDIDHKEEQAVNTKETFNKPYIQINSPFVINDDEILQPFSQLINNGNNHKSHNSANSKPTRSQNLTGSVSNFNDEVLEIQRKNPFIIINESTHTNSSSLNKNKQNKNIERTSSAKIQDSAVSIQTSDNENILTGIFNFEGVTVDLELTGTRLKWKSISGSNQFFNFTLNINL